MRIVDALRGVAKGGTLTREETRATFGAALSEAPDPAVFGGLLAALAQRGETPDEIAGAADALRDEMVPFEHDYPDEIDTCGTGGDGLHTFNVSTAAAIVAAAGGAHVIKHGNRSLSSKCGSADLLEACGVPLELEPGAARAVLDEVGITFLFAPRYHPAMRFAGPFRKALGIRTVFNYLGPLCNPGQVRRQLLGINDVRRLDDFAAVLEASKSKRAYVVHGSGGADELTLAGKNNVRSVGGAPFGFEDPQALGLSLYDNRDLKGGDASVNKAMLDQLLAGEQGAVRDSVLLNASAALVVAGLTDEPGEGLERAREAIDSGAARAKLEAWIAAGVRYGSSG